MNQSTRQLAAVFGIMVESAPSFPTKWVPDGEPRVPKIGENIKVCGSICQVTTIMSAKQQVYKRKNMSVLEVR